MEQLQSKESDEPSIPIETTTDDKLRLALTIVVGAIPILLLIYVLTLSKKKKKITTGEEVSETEPGNSTLSESNITNNGPVTSPTINQSNTNNISSSSGDAEMKPSLEPSEATFSSEVTESSDDVPVTPSKAPRELNDVLGSTPKRRPGRPKKEDQIKTPVRRSARIARKQEK